MSSNDVKAISDPYGYLGFIQNPDGSVTRKPDFSPGTTTSSDPANLIPTLTKDISINQQNKTWARIYLPPPETESGSTRPATKLPLIVYYHGGGFILCSAATPMFQKFCCDVVHRIPAVIVSVEYRLAPEHRLPAAYDDCMEALHWIKTTDDEWLTKYADLSGCFLMGSSAGGNIAYHVGLRAATCVDQLLPLKIKGLILQHPFFGGFERTPSEIRLANDTVVPPCATDVMWDLALPTGADRDHEYSNPVKDIRVELLDKVRDEGWKFLVTGCEGDPLIDRQIELAKMLKEKGVDVTQHFGPGGYHGIDFFDDSHAKVFYDVLVNFVLTL